LEANGFSWRKIAAPRSKVAATERTIALDYLADFADASKSWLCRVGWCKNSLVVIWSRSGDYADSSLINKPLLQQSPKEPAIKENLLQQ
jgi:hypothetical protein